MRTALLAIAVVGTLVAGPVAHAAAPAGTGPIVGLIDYSGDGLPPLGDPCTSVTFDIEATSLTASVGTFGVAGSGSGFCESALLGGGSVSLSIDFVAVDGTVYDCPTTTGSYIRTTYQLDVLLPANCTVGAYGTAQLVVMMRATLVPDTPYGWFAGTFAIMQS